MEKVYQNRFGLEGNCLSAVMATLLKVKLEDVPFFHKGCAILNEKNERLENKNNILFWKNFENYIDSLGMGYEYFEYTPQLARSLKGLYLVGGKSKRDFQHAVIYKGGKLWHDPHPEGGGVIPEHIFIFYKVFKED